ncbi:hypothetical protein BABINDRAFT_24175, partial [Babjeviella inositovora NRRL Y-12698]
KWSVPIRAVVFGGVASLVVGLLCVIGTTAANALFSMYVAGNYFAWGTPIFLRLTFGRLKFTPGKFYTGDFWSPVIGWAAVLFMMFVIVMVQFPANPTVDSNTMNYTCVITPGVMILSLVYYFVYARKFYHGPASNIEEDYDVMEG